MKHHRTANTGWMFRLCLCPLILLQIGTVAIGAEKADSLLHLPRTADGWSVVQTENFRIRHNQTQAYAEQVALAAEKTRAAMFDKWLGNPPDSWTPRCDIWLHPSAENYSRATGVPAQMPGHSTTRGEAQRIVARRIDLRCDHPELLRAVLPHEVTHVVLADRFGEKVPVWANEGMAVLSEPRERVARHCGNVPRYWREGKLFSAAQMIDRADYPPQAQMASFYSQSVLLVDFLVAQKGSQTFVTFVDDISRIGYAPALRQYYGWTPAQLEQRWQNRVQQEAANQTLNPTLAKK